MALQYPPAPAKVLPAGVGALTGLAPTSSGEGSSAARWTAGERNLATPKWWLAVGLELCVRAHGSIPREQLHPYPHGQR